MVFVMSPSSTISASSPRATAPPHWAPAGRTIALLVIAGVLVVGQSYVVLALYAPMADTFGVDPAAVTWTSTAFGFAYAVGFLVAGPLSDRLGPRTMIIGCMMATSVTTALVPAASSLGPAVGLRVLQGLTASMFAPAAYSYAATHLRPERRAMALSFVSSSLLAAAIIMQIAAQVVAGALNWQAVFLLCVPLFVLLALASWFVLQPSPPGHGTSVLAAFGAMPRLVAKPRLATLYLAAMALLGGFVAVYTTISLVGPSSVADDPGSLLALRASSLPAMLLIPLASPLLARIKPLARSVIGLGLAALAVLGAAFLDASPVGLAIALLIFVAGIVTAAPAIVEVVGAVAGAARGSATALYAFAMFAGGSIGTQLVGGLTGMGFSRLLLAIACVLGVGALLALASARRS